MTEEQIKEELSNCFVSILACRKGYILTKPPDTGGVDFSITFDEEYTINGRTRYIQSDKSVDLQLKATTEKAITRTNKGIKYDLEIKNFDDLIFRNKKNLVPLILILFVLPDDKEEWVKMRDEELALKKYAYWFSPQESLTTSNNKRSVRIEIPLEQKMGLDSISMFFDKQCNRDKSA